MVEIPQTVGELMVAVMLGRVVAGDVVRPAHVGAVTARDLTLIRSAGSYFWLVLSGFAEPLLYLLAVGWGVGSLVGAIPLEDGRSISYQAFIAPALLATSAMNGALAEATINFFAKLRYLKHYDSVLNTPVTPAEVAFGELMWATIRGALYSGAFLLVMIMMGLVTPWAALAAFPAALLICLAFSAVGLAMSTFMRDWSDFEYSGVVQFALFVFSGTFVPLSVFPEPARILVELTPLYHGVELTRAMTLGPLDSTSLVNLLYLLVLMVAATAVAARRMRRRLRR
ncbi:ABC transporter permease [Kibdelosporangium persicum]|uniref:ABC transporter permease n=1 Tax=Kibdelosporangium persicum TaxID=2698649 RepID=UPI001C26C6E3|nr:ABC transporter permease [Kibdelosporangium persicum]